MRYLFIYHSPDVLGGIETLIGRMARWLIDNGHEVTLLTTNADNWRQLMPPEVSTICLKRRYRDLCYPFLASRLWDSLRLPVPDVIKTFDLPSSWAGCILVSLLKRPVKLVSGIYNPHVFAHSKGKQCLMNGWPLYLKNYLRNIPNNARVFCDPSELAELQSVHGDGQSGVFWPLPIDGMRFQSLVRKPRWGKIVSIGRLAPMKEYNLYMIDVVSRLRARGYEVDWTVYGSGVFAEQMREEVQRRELQDCIKMPGDVDYQEFGSVLQDAYVFVGMGTAVIEASFCRVPNVIALAYERDGKTYGPIYRLPFGSTGQVLKEPPQYCVETEIARILDLAPDGYEREMKQVENYVQQYSINSVMEEFEQLVEHAAEITPARWLYYRNYLYAVGRAVGVRLDDWERPLQ